MKRFLIILSALFAISAVNSEAQKLSALPHSTTINSDGRVLYLDPDDHTLAATGTDKTIAFSDFKTALSLQSPLTFSTGLTNTGGTITINTSQAITKISNLTSNGFVKTSGGDGTLSVDTGAYLTGNQTITVSGDASGSGATAITLTVSKLNGTSLAGLGTGLLKNTTGTGVPSIAVAGTDYQAALTFGAGLSLTGSTLSVGDLSATYQPLDSDLTAIAALTTTTFGRSLLTQADAAAGRTALGLGTAATQASTVFLQAANNLSDLANAATARTNLGLAIGTNVQAYSGTLATLAAGSPLTAGSGITITGTWPALTVAASGGGGGGAVVAVRSVTKTDVFTTTSTTFTDITGLAITYAPTSASNKILLMWTVSVGMNYNVDAPMVRLARGGSGIAVGDAAGSRIQTSNSVFGAGVGSGANALDLRALGNQFLDAPSTTSATTYSMQIMAPNASSVSVNASFADPNSSIGARGISTLTIMEVTP